MTPARPRVSSKTSGFFFCGMMLEPVASSVGKDEIAVLVGREENHVPGQSRQVPGHRPEGREHGGLELAARQLDRRDGELGRGEAESLGDRLPVERQWDSVTGGAAQRAAVGEIVDRAR